MTDLEAEREQKQRDFDRKLLLAKSKIEMEEASVVLGLGVWLWEAGSFLPSGVNKPGQESGDWGFQLRLGAEGCVALAPVTLLHIEKIGLAIAFHIFLFSNRTFIQLKSMG